ncbi:ABC transporter substrate-binding protein [Tuberibacillus sp. Marseille-P3662]|uniref:ABC transporter substrate-binding protein n=1 Tax=Tuberibacillus sp. Marseille-P3662 TaxID=1965358 RepID=UPI000A1C9D07|nr:ABC transporter substrate-binding protein [Tuberibacillus sp. Marseille-P3662]
MKSCFRLTVLVLLTLMLVIMTACGNQSKQNQTDQDNGGDQQEQHKEADQAFPVTMKDQTGKQVTLKQAPERIVSLLPSNTEIAFALGLDDQMVGVTNNDTYPKAVKDLPKVGGLKINVEKVVSLNPDLVLAQQINKPKAIKKLRQSGIKVFVVKNPTTLNGIYDSITTIGKLTGMSDQSQHVIEDMKTTISDVKQKVKKADVKKKKIWTEISASPNIYTAGQGTFMNQLIQIIGGNNVASDLQGYPKVTEEAAVKYNPDIIILTYGDQKAVQSVLNREAWQNVGAVKNERVYTINTNLVSRPGPRISKGVVELAKRVYPDAFGQ